MYRYDSVKGGLVTVNDDEWKLPEMQRFDDESIKNLLEHAARVCVAYRGSDVRGCPMHVLG